MSDRQPATADKTDFTLADRRVADVLDDGRFRRDYPRQARELDMMRVNMHRLQATLNALLEQTEAPSLEPVQLFFPLETSESLAAPSAALRDFLGSDPTWVDTALCVGLTGLVVADATLSKAEKDAADEGTRDALQQARRLRVRYGGVEDPIADINARLEEPMERDSDRKVLEVFVRMAADGGADANRRLVQKAAKHYRRRQERPRYALVGGAAAAAAADDDEPEYISVDLESGSDSDSVESGWSG